MPDSPLFTLAALVAAADEWDHAPDENEEFWAQRAISAFFAAQDRDALAAAVLTAIEARAAADVPPGTIGYEPTPTTITLADIARLAVDALLGPA